MLAATPYMRAPAIPLVDPHVEAAAHQELAAAVVRQAVADLGDASPAVRASAVEFLRGSDALIWWTDMAGLDADVVVEYARPLLEPSPEQTATVETSRRRRLARAS